LKIRVSLVRFRPQAPPFFPFRDSPRSITARRPSSWALRPGPLVQPTVKRNGTLARHPSAPATDRGRQSDESNSRALGLTSSRCRHFHHRRPPLCAGVKFYRPRLRFPMSPRRGDGTGGAGTRRGRELTGAWAAQGARRRPGDGRAADGRAAVRGGNMPRARGDSDQGQGILGLGSAFPWGGMEKPLPFPRRSPSEPSRRRRRSAVPPLYERLWFGKAPVLVRPARSLFCGHVAVQRGYSL